MANEGCFLDLKPIAEAKVLKLRPLCFAGECCECFSVEYPRLRSWATGLVDFGERDHHVRGGDEKVEDMLRKQSWRCKRATNVGYCWTTVGFLG